MALRKAITYKSIVLNDAYYRVVRPQIDVSKNTMTINVWVFPSQAVSEDPANMLPDLALYYGEVPYAITGGDPFAQAYAYLRTLPEFADAVDVFDAGMSDRPVTKKEPDDEN